MEQKTTGSLGPCPSSRVPPHSVIMCGSDLLHLQSHAAAILSREPEGAVGEIWDSILIVDRRRRLPRLRPRGTVVMGTHYY